MRKKRKRGRPPKYVRDREGKPIVGMSCDENGFYNTHYRSEGVRREHFGAPDEFDLAVYEFHKWLSKREKKVVKDYGFVDIDEDGGINVKQRIIKSAKYNVREDTYSDWKDEFIEQTVEISESYIFEKMKQLFSKYPPATIAKKVGIPELANLHSLKPLPKPLSLIKIGEIYLKRKKKPLRKQEYDDSQRWWEQFCKLVKVKTIREVTLKDIKRYQDELYSLYDKNEYSSTWLKHRFDKIKTILNYALKSDAVEYTQDIEAVLILCKKFVYPDRASVDPKPISRDDFLEILNVANTKEKAILFLAANAALYPQDVCDIKKKHLDFEKKHLVMERGKTGIPRVACLWGRTIRAIKKMQKEEPHNSEYLFITFFGKPYCAHGIGSIWRKLRAKVEVEHRVKFEHIRDACQTAGVDADCTLDEVRFLLGHRVQGVTDNYLNCSKS